LGRRGSKGAIFFHCTSVSNGPDRAIRPPTALLTLLISHFRQFNHSHLNGLSTVVQQLLVTSKSDARHIEIQIFSQNSLVIWIRENAFGVCGKNSL
jgi:hypothetical protein